MRGVCFVVSQLVMASAEAQAISKGLYVSYEAHALHAPRRRSLLVWRPLWLLLSFAPWSCPPTTTPHSGVSRSPSAARRLPGLGQETRWLSAPSAVFPGPFAGPVWGSGTEQAVPHLPHCGFSWGRPARVGGSQVRAREMRSTGRGRWAPLGVLGGQGWPASLRFETGALGFSTRLARDPRHVTTAGKALSVPTQSS